MVASLRGITINEKTPELDKAYFIAPNSAIFGDVRMETGVFSLIKVVITLVWNNIERGKKSNQDWQKKLCS